MSPHDLDVLADVPVLVLRAMTVTAVVSTVVLVVRKLLGGWHG